MSAPQLQNGSIGAWLGSLPNTYRICFAKADVAVEVAVASVKLRVKQFLFLFFFIKYKVKRVLLITKKSLKAQGPQRGMHLLVHI